MEAFYSFLALTSILFFFTLISIVLLVVSTNDNINDSEITRTEKKLLNEIRTLEKAEKAVLKHLDLKEKKDRQKTIKIGKLPLTKNHDLTIVDLRERHIVKRKRTKSIYKKIS